MFDTRNETKALSMVRRSWRVKKRIRQRLYTLLYVSKRQTKGRGMETGSLKKEEYKRRDHCTVPVFCNFRRTHTHGRRGSYSVCRNHWLVNIIVSGGWVPATQRRDWLITVQGGMSDVTGRARATIGHQLGWKLPSLSSSVYGVYVKSNAEGALANVKKRGQRRRKRIVNR